MKKLLISLILLGSILIGSFAYAGITGQEAKKYLDNSVFVILNYSRLYPIYGIVTDVIIYKGELHLILKTGYYEQPIWFVKLEDILLIRERKSYE